MTLCRLHKKDDSSDSSKQRVMQETRIKQKKLMCYDAASYIYAVDRSNINLERALLLDRTLQFSSTIKGLEAQVDVIL